MEFQNSNGNKVKMVKQARISKKIFKTYFEEEVFVDIVASGSRKLSENE